MGHRTKRIGSPDDARERHGGQTAGGGLVEIKVGIQHVNREIVVETNDSAKQVEKDLADALERGEMLTLNDSRGGRKVLIPAASISYLDIGEENARVVGFGSV
jgi:hypothetical protein